MIDGVNGGFYEMLLVRTAHPTLLNHVGLSTGECWWWDVFLHRGDVSAANNTVQ
jgi:hypothetical protein